MIVCICTGASEREIRRAVNSGADSIAELSDSCGAGEACGQCHSMLLEMLERESCGGCARGHTLGAVARRERRART